MNGMGRKPRVHFEGAVYHAMSRGVDGRDVFLDDDDRRFFLSVLSRVESKRDAKIIAYCLMGNHFHLAIRVGRVPLSMIMQRLLTAYCLRFNWRHDRAGHLFQARYKSSLCMDDAYLTNLIRYIHMNPVRAGFVSSPFDWPWSSVKEHGLCPEVDADFDPWLGAEVQPLDLKRFDKAEKPDLESVAVRIAMEKGVSVGEIRSRCRERRYVDARRALTREATSGGHSLSSIARWLNTAVSTVSRYSDRE
jgi:REP element-mobilizing transposase RayT